MHYLDFNKILSYNIPLNILITMRGYGKTYGTNKYVIKEFKKNHSQFLYIRRYKNELQKVFQKDKKDPQKDYFNSIRKEFPEDKLEAKNNKFYINDEVFGYAMRLTEAQDNKSVDFSTISTIIFDEYPIEKNGHKFYLPDEGMILMGLIDTISRNREKNDLKIFILGNAVDDLEYSPIFSFFGLSLPYGSEFKTFQNNSILVYYGHDEEFIQERQETLVGQLSQGTKYQKYAFENKILNKNSDFIEKKNGSARFSFAFVFMNNVYGVWNDFKSGKVYVSLDYDKNSPYVFSITLQDLTPNLMMISVAKNYNCFKNFLKFFKLGLVYYENQKIKKDTFEVIKYLNAK